MMTSARDLHILIAHFLPHVVSGAERSIADLVEELDTRIAVTMLVPGEGRLADFYRGRGLDVWVREVTTPRRLFPGLHEWQSRLFARQLQAAGFNMVIANTFAAAGRVRTAARLAGLPLGIYVREVISDKPLHREILAQADLLMVISRDLQQYIGRLADPSKIRLTYNYINPRPILERVELHQRSGRRSLPYPRRTPVVGLVGRITPWKQQDVFIRAIPLILEEFPECRFVIAGRADENDRPYEEGLHRLAHQLGLEDYLTFMGERQDAIELTSELTVSALTSTREPLGRVILEAHLVGTPVVVPSAGGPAEIVEDGVTGLHFDASAPDAVEQFASQVMRLLGDETLRACLIERARERVLETFAGRKHITIQQDCFLELAAKKGGRA